MPHDPHPEGRSTPHHRHLPPTQPNEPRSPRAPDLDVLRPHSVGHTTDPRDPTPARPARGESAIAPAPVATGAGWRRAPPSPVATGAGGRGVRARLGSTYN